MNNTEVLCRGECRHCALDLWRCGVLLSISLTQGMANLEGLILLAALCVQFDFALAPDQVTRYFCACARDSEAHSFLERRLTAAFQGTLVPLYSLFLSWYHAGWLIIAFAVGLVYFDGDECFVLLAFSVVLGGAYVVYQARFHERNDVRCELLVGVGRALATCSNLVQTCRTG